MKYDRKLLLPIILVCVLSFFLASKVFAQTTSNYDVTVSPVFFDLSAKPGTTINEKVRIRNNTSEDISLKIEVKRLGGDALGNLELQEPKDDPSLSWVKFENTVFKAKPQEWTDVPFSIEVPNEAAFGYYFAATFSQYSEGKTDKTGAAVTGASSVPILLNVKKEGAKAEASIVEFKPKFLVNEYLPVDFMIKIKNTGNIHIQPKGNVFVKTGKDKDLAILDVNQTLANILPGTNRSFQTSWSDGFLVKQPVIEYGEIKKDKNGNTVEKLTINWNNLTSFRIGKYNATLLMVFDNGQRDEVLQAETSFWVLPYKTLAILLVVIVIVVLLAKLFLNYYIGREIKRRSKK